MSSELSPGEREQLLREQAERQREQADEQTARDLARGAAMDDAAAAPGYWDVIGDPDIKRGAASEHLDDFLATELSDKFALGNITHGDWKSWTWQIETEFWTMRNEMQDQDSELDEVDMAAMYGEQRPVLTNERERRLRSAMQVKKVMTSLSVGARGLRSGTEIHAVAKTENPEQQEEGGFLSGVKERLV